MKEVKEKFIAVLKLVLGGDLKAAEYLLLNLISRVHTRHAELILGNLSINFANLTNIEVKSLIELIKLVVPITN